MNSMREVARTFETHESGEMRRLRRAGCAHQFVSREAFNRHARGCGGRPGDSPAEGKHS